MILSNFLSKFITEDAKDDLWGETKNNMSLIEYRDVVRYVDGVLYVSPILERKKDKSNIVDVLIIEDDGYKYTSIPNAFNENITDETLEDLTKSVEQEVFKVTINDTKYFALTVKSQDLYLDQHEYYFVSLIPTEDISESINSMRLILLGAVLLISVITISLTTYYDKQLTKPIKSLVLATERIAEKNFDEKIHLKTGDEFESLGNAINLMTSRLKELDIEQKHFYENISHDIKTPLAVISGYAQNIQSGLVKNETKVLDTIVSECDRLKSTLENVIFLSKLDSVDEFFIFETVDLNEIIGNCLNDLQSLFVLNGIDVYFEPQTAIYLSLDGNKIKKAFANILMNCIKYTDNLISIEVSQSDDLYQVIIKDNGVGFNQEILENPITRRTMSDHGGNGIGLSIIEKVILAHHGHLKLENSKDGAMYILTFSQI